MAKILALFRIQETRNRRFSELVHPHLHTLYRMAYRWTQSRQDAEDLVQETLIKLVDRIGEMERVEKLKPWLIKVLYRTFVDQHRKSGKSPGLNGSTWRGDVSQINGLIDQLPDENINVLKRLELQRGLIRALETLNDDQRDIILLHDMEGYTAHEIGSILDISIGTVKSRLHRARAHLKRILGPEILEIHPCNSYENAL